MGRARSADPIQQFRFAVEIEGISDLGFSKVSGLDVETEVTEYDEGGFRGTHKLPGKKKTGTVVLERGATRDIQLYNWYKAALTQDNFRKTVTIVEKDSFGNEVKRHILYEAWASKFTPPEFDASSSEVAIEQVEIQYEDEDVEQA